MARSTYIYHVYDLARYDEIGPVQIPHIRPFTVKHEAKSYVDAHNDPAKAGRFKCIRYRDGVNEAPVEIQL